MKSLLHTVTLAAPSRRKAILSAISVSSSRIIAFGGKDGHDSNLAQLTAGVGQAAALLGMPLALQERLNRIAAFCMGWLEALGEQDPLDRFNHERERQQMLLASERILFNCDSPVVDPRRKLRVLVEELGEVSLAIDRIETARHARSRENYLIELKHELVHVGAVAIAWLETPEVQS